jgi:hypothetical protein
VVTIRNEMVHEARIIPLDGRARVSPAIRSYLSERADVGRANILSAARAAEKAGSAR